MPWRLWPHFLISPSPEDMQIHELKRQHSRSRSRRIGRAGGRGKTSGRGTKGQKARAGAKIRPAIRDIIKKLPKRRGYRFRPFGPRPRALGLERIALYFPAGAVVDPASLLASGLVRRIKGRMPTLRVTGGSIAKPLTFRGLSLSRGAQARVLEAGGRVND